MPKVLIMEDDGTLARVLMIPLRRAGIEVETAHDAFNGFRTCLRGQPDVVVLDLTMPLGAGYAMADKMDASPECAFIPKIMVSDAPREETEARTSVHRPFGIVAKPLDVDEVLPLIRSAIAGVPVS